MRLWTLHPQYLDARGLTALWREALLAQAVLRGQTRGYVHHPQLHRFRRAPSPRAAIASYLQGVHAEALRRGYRFDGSKIAPEPPAAPLPTTPEELLFEWRHLREKLRRRDPARLTRWQDLPRPDPHPLFSISRDAGGLPG